MTSTDLETTTAAHPAITEQSWFDTTMAQAEVLASTDIIPAQYRGKPADIVVAAMFGRDFGWSPTQSLMSISVVEGRPTLNAQSMVALVRARGHSIVGESASTQAVVTGRRGDTGDEMTVTFTMDDAARAGLAGRNVWKKYPAAMCWARAVSQLCRMLFADELAGISYTPEEVESIGAPPVDTVAQVVADPTPADQLDWAELRGMLGDKVRRLDPERHGHWEAWKTDPDHGGWHNNLDLLAKADGYVTKLLIDQGEEPFDVTEPRDDASGDVGHEGDTATVQPPPAAEAVSPSPADTDIVDAEIVP